MLTGCIVACVFNISSPAILTRGIKDHCKIPEPPTWSTCGVLRCRHHADLSIHVEHNFNHPVSSHTTQSPSLCQSSALPLGFRSMLSLSCSTSFITEQCLRSALFLGYIRFDFLEKLSYCVEIVFHSKSCVHITLKQSCPGIHPNALPLSSRSKPQNISPSHRHEQNGRGPGCWLGVGQVVLCYSMAVAMARLTVLE